MKNDHLAEQWLVWLRVLKNQHFEASHSFSRYHRRTGFPLVILSALANAGVWAVLAELGSSFDLIAKLAVAVISAIVAILSAVLAFMGFDKRSEMHKNAAMKYSSLAADLEMLIYGEGDTTEAELKEIKEKWSSITENAPVLPGRNEDSRTPDSKD